MAPREPVRDADDRVVLATEHPDSRIRARERADLDEWVDRARDALGTGVL